MCNKCLKQQYQMAKMYAGSHLHSIYHTLSLSTNYSRKKKELSVYLHLLDDKKIKRIAPLKRC